MPGFGPGMRLLQDGDIGGVDLCLSSLQFVGTDRAAADAFAGRRGDRDAAGSRRIQGNQRVVQDTQRLTDDQIEYDDAFRRQV